jgi:hypothetical protein
MEAKDWLPILFERSNATSTLWNIEIAVILGLVAFLAAAGRRVDNWPAKLALLAAYLVMAWLNLLALIQVSEQRALLAAFVRTLKDGDVLAGAGGFDLIAPLHVPSVWLVLGAHLTVDVLVCAFIWHYPATLRLKTLGRSA